MLKSQKGNFRKLKGCLKTIKNAIEQSRTLRDAGRLRTPRDARGAAFERKGTGL
jgi:hypothetical protein